MDGCIFGTSQAWDEYVALQSVAERSRRLDHKSWALDEQMDSLICNSVAEVSDQSVKRLHNLATNRAKKFRRRVQLLREEYFPACRLFDECDVLGCMCHQETIAQIREKTTQSELAVFQALADGDDYATIAAQSQLTMPALKSRISRCRARLQAVT